MESTTTTLTLILPGEVRSISGSDPLPFPPVTESAMGATHDFNVASKRNANKGHKNKRSEYNEAVEV